MLLLAGTAVFSNFWWSRSYDIYTWDLLSTHVYAQTPATAGAVNQEKLAAARGQAVSETEREFANGVEMFTRAIYMVLRPALAIWWLALDNSLVYGEMFFLDTTLFGMWQMTRTAANFALWFLFLFVIWYNLAKGGNADGPRWLKKFIPNLLIASVLIQSSYFLIAAVLDLSTVLIFAVGTAPLRYMEWSDGEDPWLTEVRFVVPNYATSLDNTTKKDASTSTHSVLYNCPGSDGDYYIPCEWLDDSFPTDGAADDTNSREWYKNKYTQNRNSLQEKENHIDSLWEISNQYCVHDGYLIEIEGRLGEKADLCDVAHAQYKAKQPMQQEACPNVYAFGDKAGKATGPLYGLYASVMRMWDISLTPNHKGIVEIGLEWMMKVIIGLGMLIPLLVLAVVLIMRAVIIRWLIIAAPFLVLFRVIWFSPGEKLDTKWDGKYSIKSFLGIIFMPVLAMFALCMSIIMMTLLTRSDHIYTWDSTTKFDLLGGKIVRTDMVLETCNIETGECSAGKGKCGSLSKHCYNILWSMDVCFEDSTVNFGNGIMNTFNYILMNAIGVFLMWTVVFAALRSAKMTEGFVQATQDFAQTAMKAAPIIYIPGMGAQSVGSLGKVKDEVLAAPRRKLADQQDAMRKMMWDRRAEQSQTKEQLGSSIDAAVADTTQANAKLRDLMSNGVTKGTDFEDYNNIPQVLWKAADQSNVNTMQDVFANPKVTSNIQNESNNKWLWQFRRQMVQNTNATANTNKQRKLYQQMVSGLNTANSWWTLTNQDTSSVANFVKRDRNNNTTTLLHLDRANMNNDKTILLKDDNPTEILAAIWDAAYGNRYDSLETTDAMRSTYRQLAGVESIAGITTPVPSTADISLLYDTNSNNITRVEPRNGLDASTIPSTQYIIDATQDVSTGMITWSSNVIVWTWT